VKLTRSRSVCVGATLIVLGAIPSTTVSAQTSLEIPLQFDFVNPGAKSLALGGAFAGVADDATAAFANPAGLALLATPEISGELRLSRTTTVALQGGRLSGTITDQGIDTIQGPDFGESTGSRFGARYASAVYPHPSHRWVIAGYRHELARVNQRVDQERISSNGVFQQDVVETTPQRETPYTAGRAVTITGYGVSGAYKLSQSVSIGAGLALYTFSLESDVDETPYTDTFGPPDYDAEPLGVLRLRGDAVAIAPTFGVLVDRGRTRVGVVYRHGASFDFTTQDHDDPPRSATFRVPHTLAVGFSFRATGRLLVAIEGTRITYSRLVDDFVTEQARASGQQTRFSVDDGTELHVGAQYALGRQSGAPVRLRAGGWYDPDHSVHFQAGPSPASPEARLFDERFATALSKGEPQLHLSGGAGFTLSPRLEFNAGLDVARRTRQFSASAIMHLGHVVQ
jgi:hypothetical protein